MSRNVLATLWWDKLHETFHSVTYRATTKIVARQVARKVELNSTFYLRQLLLQLVSQRFWPLQGMLHKWHCYDVKCFVQLVPPHYRQNIARQVARSSSRRNSAFSRCGLLKLLDRDLSTGARVLLKALNVSRKTTSVCMDYSLSPFPANGTEGNLRSPVFIKSATVYFTILIQADERTEQLRA